MKNELIKKLWPFPDAIWDWIFGCGSVTETKFEKPPYKAVRVSDNYILVKVPKVNRPG